MRMQGGLKPFGVGCLMISMADEQTAAVSAMSLMAARRKAADMSSSWSHFSTRLINRSSGRRPPATARQ